ncbi:MAG: class B sortase [Lachnospiraceae bacterium]
MAKRRGRRNKKKETRRITAGSIIRMIILLIAIGVFIYSAYQLYLIYHGRALGDKEYSNLKDIGLVTPETSGEDRYTVDFDALWELNPDIVAWIRFDEPSIISYPVVHGKDNEEYLTRTISGFDNTYGAIFLNADNKGDFTDFNSIVYGHRMKNKTMFGSLDEYKDTDFWSQYPYFYIYTPDGAELKYRIFGAGTVHQESTSYQYGFADDADKEAYLEYTKGAVEYDSSVEVTINDRIVTLSTCTAASDQNRYILCGVLVETN